MATGGSPVSEPGVVECPVCLESMLTKNPRILNCGHSFCMPCIQKISDKDPITCPICREETKLPNEGVEGLPKNDKLQNTTKNHCGPCLRHNKQVTATHTCDKCPDKLICGSCVEMHSRFPPLKSHLFHAIAKEDSCEKGIGMCKVHKQILEYYCTECHITLCFDCMYINEHSGHEEKVIDIDNGTLQMKNQMLNLNHKFVKQSEAIQNLLTYMKRDMEKMNAANNQLTDIQKELQQNLRHAKESQKTICDHQELLSQKMESLVQLQTLSTILFEDYIVLEDLTGSDYINKAKVYKEQQQELMKQMQKPSESYVALDFIPGEFSGNVGKIETTLRDSQQFGQNLKELTVSKPVLYKQLKSWGGLTIQDPEEILSVGDGTVIFVNKGKSELVRIDKTGRVIDVYKESNITGATISMGCLYVACYFTISKIALNDKNKKVTYKHNIESVGQMKISTAGLNMIMSTYNSGHIIEYNGKDTKVCVSGLSGPRFVTSAIVNGEQIYTVTESGKKVNVYDGSWKLFHSISAYKGGDFKNISGTSITPGGKLLIADSDANIVCAYNLDGTFVRDILSSSAVQKPSGVLYEYPYLWVTEGTNSIKLFRVD